MIEVRVDQHPNGFWSVTSDDWDGASIGDWLFEEQAEMAKSLIENDGLGLAYDEKLDDIADAVRESVAVEVCTVCEKQMMACQILDDRCAGCTP